MRRIFVAVAWILALPLGAARVLLLDDLSDQGLHAQLLKAALLARAPKAELRVVDAGLDLGAELTALRNLDPQSFDVVLFGTAHAGYSQAEYEALLRLEQAGLLLVAPTGNQGGLEPLYPAAYPFVASVGSLDEHGAAAPFNTLHQNLKFLLPGPGGSSFAAAALAGHAARLLDKGQPRAGLLARLQARRRGLEPGPRPFVEDDGEAERLPPPPKAAPRPKRGKDQALLLLGQAPPVRAWLRELQSRGIHVQHCVPAVGAVLEADPAGLAWLRQQPWTARLTQEAVDPAGLAPDAARLAGVWNDLYQGGLEARGQGATLDPGGALLGCADAPKQPEASPDQVLERQGLWAPSPPLGATYNDSSVYLAGRVAVGVFLVESNGAIDASVCNWTAAQEALVQAKIMAALDWIRQQNPAAQVQVVYDWHFRAPCDYEPITHSGFGFSPTWTQNVISKQSQPSVRAYNDALRRNLDADWAFTIFVANDQGYAPSHGFFTDGRFAFAYLGGPYEVMTYSNDNWGIANMDAVCAHESGHIFNALDEYAGPSSPSQRSGYFYPYNSNSVSGGTLNDPYCPMRGTVLNGSSHYCSATRLMLGWRDQDADGKTDVLDTLPKSTWSVAPPATAAMGATVTLHGSSVDQALPPLGPYSAVTLNAVNLVQFRVNGGAWNPASFDDGSGDESREAFSLAVGPLGAGSSLVEVRAVNSAGNTETAFLSCTINSGTATVTATVSPTPSASPTFSRSPTAGPSATASLSPTFGATPTPWPVGSPVPGCQLIGSPLTGFAYTLASHLLWRSGQLHHFYWDAGQVHLQAYNGSSWSERPGFPVLTDMAHNILEDGNDLWWIGTSTTCSGCDPGGSTVAFKWDGATVQVTSPIYLGTGAGEMLLVKHQGRVWVLYAEGIQGMRFRSYDGSVWQDEALVPFPGPATPPGGFPVNYATNFVGASDGDSIYFTAMNFADHAFSLWAWDGSQLSQLHQFPNDTVYATAQMASYQGLLYLFTNGTHPYVIQLDPVSKVVTDVSQGLNGRPSFAYVGLYAGGDGLFATCAHAYGSLGQWMDLYQWNGARWWPINCGPGLPTYSLAALLVEGGRSYTSFDVTDSLGLDTWSVFDCPGQPPCPQLSPTFSPTPGPYFSPSPTRTPTRSATRTVSPSITATGTASATPLPFPTATPTPTPHLCGSVLRVCSTGTCPFWRVADAIAAACPGDRIEVEGGQYVEEGLRVAKDLEIVGVPGVGPDGAWDRPLIQAQSSAGVLWLDLSSPHAVTLTNLALVHGADLDGVRLSMSAGAWVALERLDLQGQAGRGLCLDRGEGGLLMQNCVFRGYATGAALAVSTSAGAGGSALLRQNSFLGLAPFTAVRLDSAAAYNLQLRANLFFNGGSSGADALALQGDPAAAGDLNAWFGFSSFYGGLAAGAGDLPATDPKMADPSLADPRYLVSSPLSWAGLALGSGVDNLGDTRPAAGQTQWSIGACEPVTPQPSFTVTRTLTPQPWASATGTPALSPTPNASPSATPSASPSATPSTTPSLSPSRTASVTASPTVSPSGTPASATPTPLWSPSASPSPSQTAVASTEAPRILRAGFQPQPNPRRLTLRLSGPADDVVLRFYTPNMVFLEEQRLGPAPGGWSQLDLPLAAAQAWQGVIFVRIRAEKRGQTLDAVTARAYYLR